MKDKHSKSESAGLKVFLVQLRRREKVPRRFQRFPLRASASLSLLSDYFTAALTPYSRSFTMFRSHMFASKQKRTKKTQTTGLLNEPLRRYGLNFPDTPPRTRIFSPCSHIPTAVKRPLMAERRARGGARLQVCGTWGSESQQQSEQNHGADQNRQPVPPFTDVTRVLFAFALRFHHPQNQSIVGENVFR